jgi:hypothetical protein
MSEKKKRIWPICSKDDCVVEREIHDGCEADRLNAERCAVCDRRSYIVDPRNGKGIPCDSCSRGFRLKLWLKHKQDCGWKIEPFAIAA